MRVIAKGFLCGILIGSMAAAGCASQPQAPAPEVKDLEANERSQEGGIYHWAIEDQGKSNYRVTALDQTSRAVGVADIRIDPFLQHEVRVTTAEHTAYQAMSFEGRDYRFVTGVDGREMVLTGSLDDEQHRIFIEVPGRSEKLSLYDQDQNMIDKEEVVRFVDWTGLVELAGTDAAVILRQLTNERELFDLFQPGDHQSSFEDGTHPERDVYATAVAMAGGDPRRHQCFECEPFLHVAIIAMIASKCWATCPFVVGKICCAALIVGDLMLIAWCLYWYFSRITNCNDHTCTAAYHNSAAALYAGSECGSLGHVCCCTCNDERCQSYCEAEGERCQFGQGPGEEVHGDCGEPELAGDSCNAPCRCSFTFIDGNGQMQKCDFAVADGGGGAPPPPGAPEEAVACAVACEIGPL